MANNLQGGLQFDESRGLRLLSLDGGGIRGLSSLLILKEIMGRLKRDEGLAEIPRPCDYFDVIGGTSTGGLIAIMLGRLRMSVSDAIKCYVELSDEIFSKKKHSWQEGKFKASLLEVAIKKILSRHSENRDAETRMFDPLLQPNSTSESKGCRAFVCALSSENMEGTIPTHFRTYESVWNPAPNCKIWEAARATSAAPTFFKPITIDDGGIPRKFVDGGVGVNNPTERVLAEAKDLFPEANISCILSIGTGQAKTISMSKTNAAANAIVPDYQLANVVKKIATDCEKMADKMAARFAPHQGVYFRFSVDQGMQNIGLGAFEKLSELAAHTSAYLRLHENDTRANRVASALKSTRSWATLPVTDVAH
ncbi:unnamed protein product [Rhizoctonia solani]|uniref:PNPLA domain-containing protein n=1 Tax=Rhizoctonia solani TaxID=456999 RepID=A0A8H3B7P5_9AGAM|nr:unnamed protein product [Rhizoctonia solani]